MECHQDTNSINYPIASDGFEEIEGRSTRLFCVASRTGPRDRRREPECFRGLDPRQLMTAHARRAVAHCYEQDRDRGLLLDHTNYDA